MVLDQLSELFRRLKRRFCLFDPLSRAIFIERLGGDSDEPLALRKRAMVTSGVREEVGSVAYPVD